MTATNIPWTEFHDMCSGGRRKEQWALIYIQAPQEEAELIFYNRFSHNPNRVTCTCCGEDYSVSEHPTLEEATGFNRGCRFGAPPKNDAGKRAGAGRYLEPGEDIPSGWEIDSGLGIREDDPPEGYTLQEFLDGARSRWSRGKEVLVIRHEEIQDKERRGDVPIEGYVWMGDE